MRKEQASELIDRILRLSRAEETFISVVAASESSLPFSANELLTAASRRQRVCTLTVRHGDRIGTISTDRTDDASIREALDRARAVAELLPPATDAAPFPGKQDIAEAPLYVQGAAEISAARKIEAVRRCIDIARAAETLAAGSFLVSDTATAVGTSAGLFLYQRTSNAHLRVRAINPDGKCSGAAERWSYDFAALDPAEIATSAVEYCVAGRKQTEIKPGRYDVILSPGVVADFLFHLITQFSAQDVREGQSFISKMDGTTQIGAKLFPSTTRLTSDPADPRIPSFPFTLEGEKLGKTIWIDDGAVRTLFTRRTKNSPEPSVPFPTNLILEGGKMHLKELIASAKRAVLVNSVSHLAMTDPTNGLLGGMTRDGLFLIEDGKITSGLKNMRFSETPVYMLKGAVEMTQSEQRSGRESTFPMLVPAIGMASFTFSASTEIV